MWGVASRRAFRRRPSSPFAFAAFDREAVVQPQRLIRLRPPVADAARLADRKHRPAGATSRARRRSSSRPTAATLRGLGAALTALHLHDALTRGCQTASLQSTRVAERM
jgi:hypothetical protein